MAADLGLVAHAAERHAHELAADGAGDRPAEAGLADARGPDEAEDRRPCSRSLELAHGEELEDALLDLLEPVVVLVEDLARPDEVEPVLGLDAHGSSISQSR